MQDPPVGWPFSTVKKDAATSSRPVDWTYDWTLWDERDTEISARLAYSLRIGSDSLPVARSGVRRQVLRRRKVVRLNEHEPRVAVRARAGDGAGRGERGDRVAALGDKGQVLARAGGAGQAVGEVVAVVALGVCGRERAVR